MKNNLIAVILIGLIGGYFIWNYNQNKTKNLAINSHNYKTMDPPATEAPPISSEQITTTPVANHEINHQKAVEAITHAEKESKDSMTSEKKIQLEKKETEYSQEAQVYAQKVNDDVAAEREKVRRRIIEDVQKNNPTIPVNELGSRIQPKKEHLERFRKAGLLSPPPAIPNNPKN